MRIDTLKPGDEVLSITQNFIAVKRANGEVDLIPLLDDPIFGLRVDVEKIITIGFGNNEVTVDLPTPPFPLTTPITF